MAAYFTRTGGSPVFIPSPVKLISSNYSVQNTDFYIGCNGVGITVTLPIGSSVNPGQSFVIKDESGNARVNTIQVTGSNTIDGSSSVTLNQNYISLTFLWTGALWSIV